eukprot:1755649-Alexandrium_andersonii.AAC.1
MPGKLFASSLICSGSRSCTPHSALPVSFTPSWKHEQATATARAGAIATALADAGNSSISAGKD